MFNSYDDLIRGRRENIPMLCPQNLFPTPAACIIMCYFYRWSSTSSREFISSRRDIADDMYDMTM
jgi:hypothetical protein